MTSAPAHWWPSLWDSSSLAMIVLGVDRRYRAINPAACLLLRASESTLTQWSYDRICQPGDIDDELDACVRLQNGISNVSYQRTFETADGSHFLADVQLIACGDEMLQLIIPKTPTSNDRDLYITDSIERLNEIANALSHDALEPGRRLGVSAGMLRERLRLGDVDDGRADQLLSTIEQEAVKLNRMLRALVKYARLSTTLEHANITPVSQLVATALAAVDLPPDTTVRTDIPSEACVRCDSSHTVLALSALFLNACQHRKDSIPLHIHVVAERQQDNWVITIADNGPGLGGVAPERVTKLLAATGPQAGAGLGLALVQAVVRAQGGELRLSDVPTGGLAAHIGLPAPHAD